MLAGVSLWIAGQGYTTSVLGRDKLKLQRLVEANQQIVPLSVDYRDYSELTQEVNKLCDSGPARLVVAWIHSTAQDALQAVINVISSRQAEEWKVFHVLSSTSSRPAVAAGLNIPDLCEYHQIQLGYEVEGGSRRWLTDAEISDGVISAIRSNSRYAVIGRLDNGSQK
jgi:hypothetical protein